MPYENLVTTRIGDIRLEYTWKDWLVYLDVTNFLDKYYEKYRRRPGNERIFRLGVQWDFWGELRLTR